MNELWVILKGKFVWAEIFATKQRARVRPSGIIKHYTCAGLSSHESPNITPVQVSALTRHQTLHLCKFERSRITRHYTCAGFSAQESPNTTPVQVSALENHQTLRLCRFERSHIAKHYTCAGLSSHKSPNTTTVQVRALTDNQTFVLPLAQLDVCVCVCVLACDGSSTVPCNYVCLRWLY